MGKISHTYPHRVCGSFTFAIVSSALFSWEKSPFSHPFTEVTVVTEVTDVTGFIDVTNFL